jgi:hypothetical protein
MELDLRVVRRVEVDDESHGLRGTVHSRRELVGTSLQPHAVGFEQQHILERVRRALGKGLCTEPQAALVPQGAQRIAQARVIDERASASPRATAASSTTSRS